MPREIDRVQDTNAHRTPERLPKTHGRPDAPLSREHTLVRLRRSLYRVSPSQLGALRDIGRFRTVALEDLARFRYQGASHRFRQDMRGMAAQGLVQTRNLANRTRTQTLPVAVLTKLGKELLEDQGQGSQRIFAGFVKPNEVRHDASIYRMYQAERQRIEKTGGTIRRIVLDYELKARVYAPLAKARTLTPERYAKRQEEVARENGLKVIGGKIPLPDLRLEYETREGECARIDLELATAHYHGGAMQAKAQAGFTFYAADGSGAHLARVLEEREITVEILSL